MNRSPFKIFGTRTFSSKYTGPCMYIVLKLTLRLSKIEENFGFSVLFCHPRFNRSIRFLNVSPIGIWPKRVHRVWMEIPYFHNSNNSQDSVTKTFLDNHTTYKPQERTKVCITSSPLSTKRNSGKVNSVYYSLRGYLSKTLKLYIGELKPLTFQIICLDT